MLLYLFIVFILLPLTGVLLIIWAVSKNRIYGKFLGIIWGVILSCLLVLITLRWFFDKTELDKSDYYGEYVINRDYFKGEQTDWQYNHFRFEITDQDSIFFYVTEQAQILETYRGVIQTTDPNNHHSARLIVQMEDSTHHIMRSNPTTYRDAWDFYLVFKSPKFNNVFFKKGQWKVIE